MVDSRDFLQIFNYYFLRQWTQTQSLLQIIPLMLDPVLIFFFAQNLFKNLQLSFIRINIISNQSLFKLFSSKISNNSWIHSLHYLNNSSSESVSSSFMKTNDLFHMTLFEFCPNEVGGVKWYQSRIKVHRLSKCGY